jgi:hypothetical protein
VVRLVDHLGVGDGAVEEHVGEEARCLLYVQLLEVGHPLMLDHLRFSFPKLQRLCHSKKQYSPECVEEVFSEVYIQNLR